jgi:hypothetical protein
MLFRVLKLLVNTAHFINNSRKLIGTAPQAGQSPSPQLFDGAVTVLDENLRQSRLSKLFEFLKCFRKARRQIHGLYAARIDRDESKSIAAFGHGDLLRNRGVHTAQKARQAYRIILKTVSPAPARAAPVLWRDGRGCSGWRPARRS